MPHRPRPRSDSEMKPVFKDPEVAGLLDSVSELMKDCLPYTAGTLELPPSAFTVYYQSKGAAKVIDLLKASDADLNCLAEACEQGTFQSKSEDISGKACGTVGKLDDTRFSTPFVPERTDLVKIVREFMLEGEESTREVTMELYGLNIYNKGSFLKSNVDTPRSRRTFGRLVLDFPTPHKGGGLVLRPEDGEEYTFEESSTLVPGEPRVRYTAFFSDVEHEVLPVTEGHRVTLTYDLCYAEARTPLAPLSASVRISRCQEVLEQLLREKSVLPKGGLLCFGLRHTYPVSIGEDNTQLSEAQHVLKGADRLLYTALTQLRLRTNVQLLYRPRYPKSPLPEAYGLSSKVIYMACRHYDEPDESVLRRSGTLSDYGFTNEDVLWITPPSYLTNIKYTFVSPYCDGMSSIDADLCIVSRVEACEQPSKRRRYTLEDDWKDSDDGSRKRSKTETQRFSDDDSGSDSGDPVVKEDGECGATQVDIEDGELELPSRGSITSLFHGVT